MQVIRPGTKVSLPQAELVNVLVNQVCITTNDHVTYQVVWWVGGERRDSWVQAHEVSAEVPDWVPVGFIIPKRDE